MLIMMAKVLLCAAALICVWFMVRGMIDMQRINTEDSDVLELPGVVRQVKPHGRFDSLAVVTLNTEEGVHQVDCVLPGPWFGQPKHRVTDLVRVFWRRGDARAVAANTIRDGQRMFIIGVVGIAIAALLFVALL